MPKKGYFAITISNDTYQEIRRRQVNHDESNENILKRILKKTKSGYKEDIDLQSKKDLLKKVKSFFNRLDKSIIDMNDLNKDIKNINNDIQEAIK